MRTGYIFLLLFGRSSSSSSGNRSRAVLHLVIEVHGELKESLLLLEDGQSFVSLHSEHGHLSRVDGRRRRRRRRVGGGRGGGRKRMRNGREGLRRDA